MTEIKKGDGDSSVARLIRLAGARDVPAEDKMERARSAAHAAWQRGLQMPTETPTRKRLSWWPLALAASCAMVAVVLMNRPSNPGSRLVATVVAVDNQPVLRAGTSEYLVAGVQLVEGASVDTRDGRAAFLLGDSLSLRADRHTQLAFEAVDQVRVLSGSVYVDSGGLNAVSQLRIETPAGEVRHLGTQFFVAVKGDATRVQVREGRVMLTRESEAPRAIAAGDALEIEGVNVRLVHGLASHGAQWEWAAATGPAFDIENRPLAEFLAWVAREHGWQLVYGDDATRLRAQEIRLHGSVADLEVTAMLERVELITGVALQARGGVLAVSSGAGL